MNVAQSKADTRCGQPNRQKQDETRLPVEAYADNQVACAKKCPCQGGNIDVSEPQFRYMAYAAYRNKRSRRISQADGIS